MRTAAKAAELDDTLTALADPTRRRVIDMLKARPHRAGELARELGLANPAMSKHLRVLRACKLVEEEGTAEDRRVRVYRLRPERFEELRDWLEDVQSFWAAQLASFKTAAERAARTSDAPPVARRRSRRSE